MRKSLILQAVWVLMMVPLYATASLENPFVYQEKQVVSNIASFRKANVTCPYPIAKPVVEALSIESKYNQSDKTKSTLATGPRKGADIKKDIQNFSKALVKASEVLVSDKKAVNRARALACFDSSLNEWAQADAIIGTSASKTGYAVRKWFLASVASAVLKIQAVYPEYRLNNQQSRWLHRIKVSVRDYYRLRLTQKKRLVNNHDYWAAWSVASLAIATDREEDMHWPIQVFEFAMNQLVVDNEQQWAYLPNELIRGDLAADYTHYALVPLMFLADAMNTNGVDMGQHLPKLDLLARFATKVLLDPKKVAPLVEEKQKKVSEQKKLWVLPYAKLTENQKARRYVTLFVRSEVGYSQMGGKLMRFYPSPIPKKM